MATEKALLLAGEPLQRLELNVIAQPQDLFAEMRAITAQITGALKAPASPPPAKLLLAAPGASDRAA